MRNVTVAAVQMQCSHILAENLATAERLVRQAAGQGAQIILLPELFERPYFCQERQYDYYSYAKSVEENDAVQHFIPIARELQVVIPISFYEKDGNSLYNSIAVIDADGSVLGVYRKTHIPDDHYYQEKFYFTPGNTGYKVWETRYAKIGIGICWDQWFPETARCLALNGAELLFTQQLSAQSRFWIQIAKDIGNGPCKGMLRPISRRSLRPTVSAWSKSSHLRKMAASHPACNFTVPPL